MLHKDETDVNFNVHCADKISMNYKAEGDGLHVDTLFQKGYIYQIFMYINTAPKTYSAKNYVTTSY